MASYENGFRWGEKIKTGKPVQDGTELMQLIRVRMKKFQEANHCEPIINKEMTAMGITVNAFIPDEMVQLELFENNIRKNTLRRVVYDIKEKFGFEKMIKASELSEEHVLKDVIGFGSVKDLHDDLGNIFD
jgi:DNA polymerase-4